MLHTPPLQVGSSLLLIGFDILVVAARVQVMSFCSWKNFVVASSAGHSVCFGPRIIDHCWQLSPPSIDKPVGNLI